MAAAADVDRRRRTESVPGDHPWQMVAGLPGDSDAAAFTRRGITNDLDSVGTPHFAQFIPLEDRQVGFFTVYDGDFDTYIADFTKNIGQVFDLLFKFTKGCAAFAMQEAPPGVHRLRSRREPDTDWLLSGISRSERSGHPCADRR